MRKHNGIRPQDLVILLKIAALGQKSWLMKELASELGISPSEVSESLHRSVLAGFVAEDKRSLQKGAIMEFMIHGLKYTFPTRPGGESRGVPTAYSLPNLIPMLGHATHLVWPHPNGTMRGHSIEPLIASQADACLQDPNLHVLLALADIFRIGRIRETEAAKIRLKEAL
jgi:hypothetical protein